MQNDHIIRTGYGSDLTFPTASPTGEGERHTNKPIGSGCDYYLCCRAVSRCLAAVRRATSEAEVIVRLEQLRETLIFYLNTQVLPYDEAARMVYEQLKKQKIRIGTQDLRIAAITLSQGATLVTRNSRDFVRVPKLTIIDWSV